MRTKFWITPNRKAPVSFFRALCENHRIARSVGRVGSSDDNSAEEPFWARLELNNGPTYAPRPRLKAASVALPPSPRESGRSFFALLIGEELIPAFLFDLVFHGQLVAPLVEEPNSDR